MASSTTTNNKPSKSPEICTELLKEDVNLKWQLKDVKTLHEISQSSAKTKGLPLANIEFNAGASIGIPSRWTVGIQWVQERVADVTLKLMSAKVDSIPAKFLVDILNYKDASTNSKGGVNMSVMSYRTGESSPCGVIRLRRTIEELVELGLISASGHNMELVLKITIYGPAESKVACDFDSSSDDAVTPMDWKTSMVKAAMKDQLSLFETGEDSDVIFSVAQKGSEVPFKINAHKCILRNRCPVFARMFNTSMKEAVTGEVFIEDISPRAMQIILKFVYAGIVDKGWGSVVQELIYASDKYQLDQLKSYLNDNIEIALTTKNVMEVKQFAGLYKLPLALTATMKFIRENLEVVLKNHDLTAACKRRRTD